MLIHEPATNSEGKHLLKQQLTAIYRFISNMNKKSLAAALGFILMFFCFWLDFIISGTTATAKEKALMTVNETPPVQPNSLILSFIKVISQVRKKTLVNTGVEEPTVNIEKQTSTNADSTQVIREVLKSIWGDNLIETLNNEDEIEFKGYNSADQMDLQLSLNKENDGTLSADGYTLHKKQRKEIIAQLGDIIHMKVVAAEDMENLCRRALKKKEIKYPRAKFNMDRNMIAIKGESDNQKIISEIEKIISRSLPAVTVNNQIQYNPEQMNIVGISNSGVEHIKLGDGSKVFPGGRLKNGCIVNNILKNRIQLKCNGTTIYYNIGENS
jgi:hypothetical protein